MTDLHPALQPIAEPKYMTRAERHAQIVGITFQELGHKYVDDETGYVPPSVTGVLKAGGAVNYEWCRQWALERGSHAHTAIHYALELSGGARLNWATLDPRLRGYVAAAIACLKHLDAETVGVEQVVYSRLFRYAGKFDWLGHIRGRSGFALIDWKTSIKAIPGTALQLAGYADAYYENRRVRITERYTALLSEDGRYELVPHEDPMDGDVFRAFAAAYHWRDAHGML
jgi:hypothetical protein